ncbi:hypothetical protein CK203_046178 [Vitis vinifera]|uniref:Uncharacterized protein n=1 Tax=Vitis vinifera TaxID=29760 RepID=A0A438I4A8_VITVI|nr:hypothetical protein CK203_046178 [Vitis vinifera]
MLAQKLRALGITSQPMKKFDLGNSTSVKEDYRGKGKEKGKGVIPDAERCGGCSAFVLFGKNGRMIAGLSREVLKISRLGGALVLFEFEDKVDAEWVLLRGSRRLQRREFFLQKWDLKWVVAEIGSHPKDVWVKVVGLPLHLWSREVFKSIGERCGGFIAVDEDTAFFSELQWARILVKAPGKIKQGTLQVIAGKCCWTASGIQVECGRGQGEAAVAGWMREGGPSQELEVRSSSARASSVSPAETEEGLDPELKVFQAENAVGSTPRGWRGTDEALMEEASRYDAGPSPLSQLGHRGHPTFLLLLLGGIAEAVGTFRRGGLFRDPGDAEKDNELALVPVGEFVMSLCEEEEACHREEGESGEGWSTSSLRDSATVWGMPTEGFEEEILYLLRRMKGRMEQKGREGVTRKKSLKSSKSSRELKKLEWTFGGGKKYRVESKSTLGEAAGGILVFWDNRVVELGGMGTRSVLNFVPVQKLCGWCCMGVHWGGMGRFGSGDREEFWEELGSVKGLWRDLGVWEGISTWAFSRDLSRITSHSLGRRRFEEGSFPFRFENMWLEEGGFKDKLKTWWGSLKFTGSASYILDAKLRALKNILKIWNKEEFGIVEDKKGEALKQVEYWDEKEKYDVLNMEDCEARNGAREAYKSWVIKEEIFWRQKSRELWLKEGDNNTRFFHRMVNAHCRRNWLSKLKVNGCWHSEENNLRNSVVGGVSRAVPGRRGVAS